MELMVFVTQKQSRLKIGTSEKTEVREEKGFLSEDFLVQVSTRPSVLVKNGKVGEGLGTLIFSHSKKLYSYN